MEFLGLSSPAALAPHPTLLFRWRNLKLSEAKQTASTKKVVCSSSSSERDEIDIKVKKLAPNINRAARQAMMTVLEVDRARLMEVDSISHKRARLLPRAILEALTDRIRAGEWKAALKTFRLLQLQEWYEPKEEIYLKLLVMLGKCKQPEEASKLFKIMLEDKLPASLKALTALLSAYLKGNCINTAFGLFAHMKSLPYYEPDLYTYGMMIKGCCEAGLFDQASLLLAEMNDSGLKPNIVLYNTLLDAFGKVGMLSQMEELFLYLLKAGTCKPDSWTWNIIIKHYGTTGDIDKMEEWFANLQEAGVLPDRITLNTLVNAYGKKRLYAKMKSVVQFMHRYLYGADEFTFNSMLDAYGKGGMIKEMNNTFIVMKRRGVKFSSFTLSRLLTAYSNQGRWDEVEKVRRQWKNSDLVPDVVLYNTLIDAYRRAGNVDAMEAAYLEMKQEGLRPDKVTFTILIQAYQHFQMDDKADRILEQMESLSTGQKHRKRTLLS